MGVVQFTSLKIYFELLHQKIKFATSKVHQTKDIWFSASKSLCNYVWMIYRLETLLSWGKPATQSSVHLRRNVPLTSDKAFDGNLIQYMRNLSCMHTNWGTKAWLQVDLLQNALIHSTKIFKRIGYCQERLRDALIYIFFNDAKYTCIPL